VRTQETHDLLQLLTNLQSRFRAEPLTEAKKFGLDEEQKPLVVTLKLADATHKLTFGSPKTGDDNAFARPTYVRLDEKPEAVRLGPGLLAILERPRSAYLRRQLFTEVVQANFADALAPAGRGDDAPTSVALLDAQTITLTGPDGTLTLTRTLPLPKPEASGAVLLTGERLAEAWKLTAPAEDKADPDRLKAVLTALPDVWAEAFVTKVPPPADADTGLDKPERTITITRGNGSTVTLHIGKVSSTKKRKGTAPPPPPAPFPMPTPAAPIITEEFRYAKLPDNPLLFEIKADKFGDLFVGLATLRDARVARFRTADVKELTLTQGTTKIVLGKEVDERKVESWRLREPLAAPAETSKVTELLDKIAEAQARDADVLDKPDLKGLGLEPPTTTLNIVVEEDELGTKEPKSKRTRTVLVHIGKPDMGKVPVQMVGWPRVSKLDEQLVKLLERPALAYRGRRLFDVSASKIESLTIERDAERYQIVSTAQAWNLVVDKNQAPADVAKASKLADDLSRLEALEYVTETPTPEQLAEFGLDKPTASVTVRSAVLAEPLTLQLGKPRPGKPETFAKLANGTSVFSIPQTLALTLADGALAWRPSEVWKIVPEQVATVKVEVKDQPAFELVKAADGWRLTGAFDAPAGTANVQKLLDVVLTLKTDKFHTFLSEKLPDFGLEPPALTVSVFAPPPAVPGGPAAAPPTPFVVRIGKPTPDGAHVFALANGTPGVFELPATLTANVLTTPLEYLDRKLLALAGPAITQIERKSAYVTLTLTREMGAWKAAGVPFPIDRIEADSLANLWGRVEALRYAAYGEQTDWKQFGLDSPAVTYTLTVKAGLDADAKPTTHTLAIGKPAAALPGTHYGRLNNGPGVVVLGASLSATLLQPPLALADKTLLALPPLKDKDKLQRRGGGVDVTLEKAADNWRLLTNQPEAADSLATDLFVDQLLNLRLTQVSEYAPKDEGKYGFVIPTATWTIPSEKGLHKLEVGAVADAKTGARYVRVVGNATVGTVSALLSRQLAGEPIVFRERNVATVDGVEGATLFRGDRKATFTQQAGIWKLTQPIAAPAENAELTAFVSRLSRLRAEEWVVEKPTPAQLKQFGLDKPTLKWHLLANNQAVLKLCVGGLEGEGKRRYAQIEGNPRVFVLGAQLSQLVVTEYRQRTLFTPPLDAAQVETLELTQVGQLPLTLVKRENQWNIGGAAQPLTRQDAVNQLLATLADLKAEQFALDTGADGKLFGLDPPQATIVARTRLGTAVTLHIGKSEGGTQRVYAQVPGTGAVVVLSLADTARLARPQLTGP
jgi:hypothetical protein